MSEIADEYSQFVDDTEGEGVVCNRCGAEGLHWEEVGIYSEVWRLFNEDGDRHDCHLEQAGDGFERVR